MCDILELGDDRDNISEFLLPYVQSGNLNFLLGSGASFPAIATAGNIEAEINELLTKGKFNEANFKSIEFIEKINSVHSSITATPQPKGILDTLPSYVEFIRILDRLLFTRKNLLLPRQANVFTTNYDMFVEHAASISPGIILNDGFDRSSGIRNSFPFAPERYSDRTYRSGAVYSHEAEIPTINLIKLHGSLSWRSGEEGIVFDPQSVPALSGADKSDSSKVEKYLKQHFLILPNMRKFHTTLMDRTYYDLLRIYANAMDRGNAVVFCFGFSFADEHILDITRRALRNPTSQLIIFSFDNGSATDFQSKFVKQRNAVVIAPQVGKFIDFASLNTLLLAVLPNQGKANGT